MKKRILAMLMAGMMVFTMVPAEVAAAGYEAPAKKQEESFELPDRQVSMGGLEEPKQIEMSDAVARTLEVPSAKQIANPTWGSQKYDTSWDVYSSNYIYNRLKPSEKKMWDMMDGIARKYLTTKANAKVYDADNAYAPEEIPYRKMGITTQRAKEIYIMFNFSNPQYYFLNNGYLTDRAETVMALVFYPAFRSGSTRASWTAKVKKQADSWKSKISKGKNEVEKAQIAHDLIIKKVTYDPGYAYQAPYTEYHQSAFSVFCDDYTVCAGYTKAYEMMMNSVGVDTMAVTSSAHAWNKISINDSWYNVDLTWDDLDGQYGYDLFYMYFNRSDAMITGSELDQNSYHKAERIYSGLLPKCTLDSGISQQTMFTTGNYKKITSRVKTPTIKLTKGSGNSAKVTLSSESGATIYYTLDGVNPSSSYSRSYRYTKPFTISSSKTLKVIAVKDKKKDSKVVSKKISGKMYTVKFDANKGSVKTKSKDVAYGDKYGTLPEAKKKGYSFLGWYTKKSGGDKITSKSTVRIRKTTTLYAHWKKVTVSKTSISKIKNVTGKKLEVVVKKVSGAKGYQIRYATRSDMKGAKIVTTSKNSKTITGLRTGKKYYVQARAYKVDSTGRKIAGKWSSTNRIQIKK